jgi:hypothetical protein
LVVSCIPLNLSSLLVNLSTQIFLSVLIGSAQVLELVNAVPYEPPSAAEEEAFLAEPCHILARLYRDLFKDEETAKATLAVCAHGIPLYLQGVYSWYQWWYYRMAMDGFVQRRRSGSINSRFRGS